MKKNISGRRRLFVILLAAVMILSVMLSGCGSSGTQETGKSTSPRAEETQGQEESAELKTEADGETKQAEAEVDENAPEIKGLTYESTMEMVYAEAVDVYYYNDGYALIDVHDSAEYLVVPENQPVPEELDEDIIVLEQPLDKIYLAATSAMALFDALDALGSIRLSGTQASGWYIDNAVKAMEAGGIIFAGKYSEPDYELLVDEECDLAIESTMILHTPKVQEMIEMLDIPVFIDRSSYETHPLGRTEWIKVYGVLVDKEEAAEAFFEEQTKVISELKDFTNTEKTVVYFYINTSGAAIVRRADDYIPKMIEIAGGRYPFDYLIGEDYTSTSISLSMEEFYATAVNADYLVYNASIDSPIGSIDELLAKSELFADFKAVKEGNVWSTGKSLYQATDIVGELIRDLNLMLTDGDEAEMTFLTRVE